MEGANTQQQTATEEKENTEEDAKAQTETK
jgi:hypothetical protein